MDIKFRVVGDQAVSVQMGSSISLEVNTRVKMLHNTLAEHPIEGVVETVPTYAALMVYYRPEIITYGQLTEKIEVVMNNMTEVRQERKTVVEIPVLYGGEGGIDLEDCAKIEHMTCEEFIKVHSQSEYYVYMLGFAPGHAYTARFENPFSFKRRESPRVSIPERTIVVQENLSNIIPFAQPCGWNYIGQTPVEVCDYRKQNPFAVSAGQWVKYVPITKSEYEKIRSQAKEGQYQCKTYEKAVDKWES